MMKPLVIKTALRPVSDSINEIIFTSTPQHGVSLHIEMPFFEML